MIQYSRGSSDRPERPQHTGYPAGACHRARRKRDPVAGYDSCCCFKLCLSLPLACRGFMPSPSPTNN